MRLFLTLILTCNLLFGYSMFTLDNPKNMNVYVDNKSDFLRSEDIAKIKKYVSDTLTKNGLKVGGIDPATMVITIESATIGDTRVVHMQLSVAEEVITKRKGAIETLAMTFGAADMFEGESEDSLVDTMESLEMLVGEYIDAYREDNEE